jgi:hypothetical protein
MRTPLVIDDKSPGPIADLLRQVIAEGRVLGSRGKLNFSTPGPGLITLEAF